ncbi:methyltransferase [Sandaracinobacter sp. RS1-74]|uniref:methyltransferase n=1 Tax=Sandaracinobacteroides sayramensis TaxID=2913411 RepID=UPI001EDC4500|nr:methyltransferase [Sandaracinobacteroides sayramensis]MCG2841162.1 methyltransferase [Sandaracinobacteroides sayramensis]
MAALLLLAGTAQAEDGGAEAAIAAALAAPDRPERQRAADAERKPAAILAMFKLAPGQRVLDVVAGQGYYTRLLAGPVGPKGRVFAHSTEGLIAVDKLQPEWDRLLASHPNVELLIGVPGLVKLPERLDRVLFHLTFHDLWWESEAYRIPRMNPSGFLQELKAAMVPGGLLLVVDHAASPGAEPRAETMARHRIDPAVVKAEMAKAGFTLEAESGLLANPADDRTKLVYDPAIRGKTDRFTLLFRSD